MREFRILLNPLNDALKSLKHPLIGLEGHRVKLENRLNILAVQLTHLESMRSRFEDAKVADLQFESSRNDLYRQAAFRTLARR